MDYADGDGGRLVLAMERVRLLTSPGQELPPPTATQLQALASGLKERAALLDGKRPKPKADDGATTPSPRA